MSRGLAFIVVAVTIAVAAPARAQDVGLETARAAFEKGQGLFEQGNFAEAAAQFEAALAAKSYPQFLFNIGACHEKLADYPKAVSYYRRYIEAAPSAPDRKKTEQRIAALEKAIEELKAKPAAPATDPANPSTTPAAPTEPPKALAGLEAAKIKGVVVIVSNPPGALIYLDSKKNRPLSKTPWNGELTGEHTIYVEREGYKPGEERIAPAADKFYHVVFSLGEEDYLGWIDITSNVVGADIYLDDKSVGVYNKTPFQGNLPPGKHTIWVSKDGYSEFKTTLEIIRGKTHKIDAKLKGAPVGYVNVRGRDAEKTSIYMDGKLLCERGPCIKPVPQGTHELTVRREGYKPYTTRVDVQAKTEVTLRAQLAERPSRVDAIVAYAVGGALIGVGAWAGSKSSSIKDELDREIDAGAPPPDPDDPRFTRGKIWAISADAAYLLGAVSLGTALYYTFRDKGAESTGTTDVRVVELTPQLAPSYAGLGMEVRW